MNTFSFVNRLIRFGKQENDVITVENFEIRNMCIEEVLTDAYLNGMELKLSKVASPHTRTNRVILNYGKGDDIVITSRTKKRILLRMYTITAKYLARFVNGLIINENPDVDTAGSIVFTNEFVENLTFFRYGVNDVTPSTERMKTLGESIGRMVKLVELQLHKRCDLKVVFSNVGRSIDTLKSFVFHGYMEDVEILDVLGTQLVHIDLALNLDLRYYFSSGQVDERRAKKTLRRKEMNRIKKLLVRVTILLRRNVELQRITIRSLKTYEEDFVGELKPFWVDFAAVFLELKKLRVFILNNSVFPVIHTVIVNALQNVHNLEVLDIHHRSSCDSVIQAIHDAPIDTPVKIIKLNRLNREIVVGDLFDYPINFDDPRSFDFLRKHKKVVFDLRWKDENKLLVAISLREASGIYEGLPRELCAEIYRYVFGLQEDHHLTGWYDKDVTKSVVVMTGG